MTYNPGTGADGDINAIAIQTDKKVIAAGNFTNFNGTTTGRIVRTDSSGSIDAAFTTNGGAGANGTINTIALQADGKIIIGGNFTFFNGISANYLARLNANGSFDNSFNIGSGGFGQVRVIRVQTDGKILIGGDFPFFNSSTIARIARLNTDGTIDNTFSPTSTGASGSVYDIQVAPDGSIFVGGAFSTYNGNNKNGLVKLTSTGNVDNTFNYTAGYSIYAINLYATGKLLVSQGYLGSNFLSRLNTNGSTDVTFTIGGGVNNAINKMALIGNGNKFLMAGSFTSFNGVGRNRIARLSDATVLPLTLQNFTVKPDNNNALLNWNTGNEVNTASFTIERSTNNFEFGNIGSVASKGNSTNDYQFTDFDMANLNVKVVYYRLKMQDNDGSFTYSPTVALKLLGKTSISMSPNPAKNIAWLQLQASTTEKVAVRVTDVSGRQVMLQSKTIGNGTTSLPLNIVSLQPGMYYVQVTSGYRSETLKLIKE